ncbi:hypothetical protein HRR83_000075 [Exophiala dermatitidis]|uniref:Uncharacterized protein n=3 Tax=Exophiala dermatitidis TaxID=5970 RepID=H6C889_EXODN|nr:uncharacterized protein HMPREF1120_08282 [Exophiala dermatitidis NIH/UT8656]KAJ4523428.1 hypothetical protein HRR73_002609 [Exophiala dermatitidis]EHY60316.1 hypothetical protein HMPREF1120_08282 [Exophiala dermatitidis NIH/UT8656]KAJ4524478.1 hypothetical protein HRR75_000066 [Exophiala dermatitidis]KAJ4527324.1 hypothetical protein HRR74_000076 [Exophiala dermatitidis]KAJ4530879.1 hypothetical protein HRR76_008571 [Exophiala dermatitidis]
MDDDDRCEQCGSSVFIVEDDGKTYCDNGHDQGRAPVTAEDELDYGRQGKVLRKKEPKEKQKVTGVLRGVKAYQLFLQAWQLILRKQCYILVHQKGLPAELWTIVRDLWILWLSQLGHRLHDPAGGSHPPTDSASEADAITTSAHETDSGGEAARERKRRGEAASHGPILVDTVVLNYLGILLLRRPIGLATILNWIQKEHIPFIRAIRHVPAEMKDRLPGEYHIALDTIWMLEPDGLQAAVYERIKMFSLSFGMTMPPLNHNLVLLHYVRSLALPIEVYSISQRLNAAITKYQFRCPDKTALKSMTRRQPTTYPEAQLMSLVVIATKLLFPFDSQSLRRYPKDPNDPTTLHMDWSSWLHQKQSFDRGLGSGPDTGDGATTSSSGDGDGHPNSLEPGSEIHVRDSDILNMTDGQLDQYMDWYQRTWIESPHTTTNIDPSQSQSQSQRTLNARAQENALDKDILDLFPLRELPQQRNKTTREDHEQEVVQRRAHVTSRIKNVQTSFVTLKAVSLEEEAQLRTGSSGVEFVRPGKKYLHVRSLEDLECGPGQEDQDQDRVVVKVFHEEAAQTACLSVKALIRAVNHTEEKIEQYLKARRREEVFGEHSQYVDDDDDGNNHDDEDGGDDDDGHEEKKHEHGSNLEHEDERNDYFQDEPHTRMMTATQPSSPPLLATASGTLARDLSGLDIRSSSSPLPPEVDHDADIDVDEDEDEQTNTEMELDMYM